MGHIFLSDVHLGAFSDEKNQSLENELISLLDYCQAREIQIHILGDLFDYWMEFPDYIPSIGYLLVSRFKKYNQAMGNNTTYITGNHDYWTKSHFEENGFKVEHEYVNLELGESNVFMCHGDGLSDEQYNLPRPMLHKFIRHPKFITFYQAVLSGKTGLHLMKSFSSFTRDDFAETERLNKWARHMLRNFQYDVIISGHDHVPRRETFADGTYINTGAFFKFQTVLKYNKGSFELVTWSKRANKFKPFETPVY